MAVSAQRGHFGAVALANKGGDALGAMLLNIAKAKQTERMGPIQSQVFLEMHFEYDELPVVGSKQGETGNKPYDKFTAEIKTTDGTRKVPGSFYTDTVKSTPQGMAILQEIEWAGQGQGEGIPPHILTMGSTRKKEYIKEQRQLLADMRTGLTKGAMLWHQLEEISGCNPARIKVKLPIMYQKGEDGENNVPVVTGNLIRLSDPAGTLEDESVTVGQFLQYDAEKAKADPDKGTLTSLKATASRAPKKKAETGKGYTIPATVEDCKSLFNVLASALDNGTEHGRKMEAQLLAACAKDGAEGDEAVMSVGGVCLAADNIWTVIQNRYNAINARKAQALNNKVA